MLWVARRRLTSKVENPSMSKSSGLSLWKQNRSKSESEVLPKVWARVRRPTGGSGIKSPPNLVFGAGSAGMQIVDKRRKFLIQFLALLVRTFAHRLGFSKCHAQKTAILS